MRKNMGQTVNNISNIFAKDWDLAQDLKNWEEENKNLQKIATKALGELEPLYHSDATLNQSDQHNGQQLVSNINFLPKNKIAPIKLGVFINQSYETRLANNLQQIAAQKEISFWVTESDEKNVENFFSTQKYADDNCSYYEELALLFFKIDQAWKNNLQKSATLLPEWVAQLKIRLSISSDFFFTQAKILAFWGMWQKWLTSLHLAAADKKLIATEELHPCLEVMTDPSMFTRFDEANNILRQTSAVMAALCCPVDAIIVIGHYHLHDLATVSDDDVLASIHIATHTLHILMKESKINQYQGLQQQAYFFEKNVPLLIDQTWQYFLQLKKEYSCESVAVDSLKEKFEIARNSKLANVQLKKHVIVGVNMALENHQKLKGDVSVLFQHFSWSIKVEQLRYEWEQNLSQHTMMIKGIILGDATQLIQRINFCDQFVLMSGIKVDWKYSEKILTSREQIMTAQGDLDQFLSAGESHILCYLIVASDLDYLKLSFAHFDARLKKKIFLATKPMESENFRTLNYINLKTDAYKFWSQQLLDVRK